MCRSGSSSGPALDRFDEVFMQGQGGWAERIENGHANFGTPLERCKCSAAHVYCERDLSNR